MKKIGMFILTLSVLFLYIVSVNTASAHEGDLPDKTFSEEGTSLNEVESEISPLYIPCDYYGNTHRHVQVGQTQKLKSTDKHSVVVRQADGSSKTVVCVYQNWYTEYTYYCACGDRYTRDVFSHTYHPER